MNSGPNGSSERFPVRVTTWTSAISRSNLGHPARSARSPQAIEGFCHGNLRRAALLCAYRELRIGKHTCGLLYPSYFGISKFTQILAFSLDRKRDSYQSPLTRSGVPVGPFSETEKLARQQFDASTSMTTLAGSEFRRVRLMVL